MQERIRELETQIDKLQARLLGRITDGQRREAEDELSDLHYELYILISEDN